MHGVEFRQLAVSMTVLCVFLLICGDVSACILQFPPSQTEQGTLTGAAPVG